MYVERIPSTMCLYIKLLIMKIQVMTDEWDVEVIKTIIIVKIHTFFV